MTIFSKLDLPTRYHQIKMDATAVEKITFRTHKSHYDFLVIPVGFSNALATFQSLMNKVFKPFLHQFIIVFFNDIIVYSTTMELHLTYLAKVLKILVDNTLFFEGKQVCFWPDNN